MTPLLLCVLCLHTSVCKVSGPGSDIFYHQNTGGREREGGNFWQGWLPYAALLAA